MLLAETEKDGIERACGADVARESGVWTWCIDAVVRNQPVGEFGPVALKQEVDAHALVVVIVGKIWVDVSNAWLGGGRPGAHVGRYSDAWMSREGGLAAGRRCCDGAAWRIEILERSRWVWRLLDDLRSAPGLLESQSIALRSCGKFCKELSCHSAVVRKIRTFQALWGTIAGQEGLDRGDERKDTPPQLVVLRLDGVLLPQGDLKIEVRLLALETFNLMVQALDLILRPLAYGSLGFAIVGPLARELLRSEVGDAARRCAGTSLPLQAIAEGRIGSWRSFGLSGRHD